jgi:transposase
MTITRRRSAHVARLEQRRLEAARMFANGARTVDVARTFGVAWRTAFKWRQTLEAKGLDGLRSRGLPGREPLLGTEQRRRLRTILRAGARKSGFPDDVWTLARVHVVVQRVFGITCSRVSVWRLLRQNRSTAGLASRREAPVAVTDTTPSNDGADPTPASPA